MDNQRLYFYLTIHGICLEIFVVLEYNLLTVCAVRAARAGERPTASLTPFLAIRKLILVYVDV